MKANKFFAFFVNAIAAWLLVTGLAIAAQDEIGQGSLMVISEPDSESEILNFPLKHTSVEADISGFIARVTVTQEFGNDFDHAIEAIYVFPLPDKAAVDDMTMTIGDRVIKGVIKKRDEAQKIYDQAKAQGRTASLLTQERPNIFTQAVANILPSDEIKITISYVQDMKYDSGEYEFNFPMVVGPRFIPGNPTGRSGGGWSPDTNQVPDASKITPPVLKPGTRSGHDIDLHVTLDAGVDIRKIHCPSHNIHVEHISESEAYIDLDKADSIPNKDFILRYKVTGQLPESALLVHSGENGGFFTLMIQPQADFGLDDITPKEMIFVVDCSGSMRGAPMDKAKEAMRRCIAGMNHNDSFQIIRFSSSASRFANQPLLNTPQNVSKGLKYIDSMAGSGGTMMIEGIKAALDYQHDPNRIRIVLFMTDGYIGNETEILAAIDKKLNGARLFSFGVGSSVNHYLLDRMAEAGRGTVQYVRPDENTDKAVDKFYDRISNPLLTDIRIDWNGLDVHDVYPAVIPDLFSAQPVIVHGRYEESGTAEITISALLNNQPWTQDLKVVLPDSEPDHDVLATLWARTRIKTLMSCMYRGERPDTVKKITDLALKYRIMSKYTAFVAVTEEVRRDENGTLETVQIPVEMPEMVSYEGVFGKEGLTGSKKYAGKSSNIAYRHAKTQGGASTYNSTTIPQAPHSQLVDKCEEISTLPVTDQDEKKIITQHTVKFKIRMVSGSLVPDKAQTILDGIAKQIETVFQFGCSHGELNIELVVM